MHDPIYLSGLLTPALRLIILVLGALWLLQMKRVLSFIQGGLGVERLLRYHVILNQKCKNHRAKNASFCLYYAVAVDICPCRHPLLAATLPGHSSASWPTALSPLSGPP